jgi:hypothetical protein
MLTGLACGGSGSATRPFGRTLLGDRVIAGGPQH